MDALKRIEENNPKRLLNKGIKKPGLKVNPALALIGLQATGSWWIVILSVKIPSPVFQWAGNVI